MDTAQKTGQWYTIIVDKIQAYVRKFDLPEDMAGELQALVIDIARQQYQIGNKSGIAWLKKQQAKDGMQSGRSTAPQAMAYST